MRAALLTVSSTRVAEGDESGDVLAARLAAAQFELVGREIVTDERTAITEAITRLSELADLVLTTGGTGITHDDVTPEATLEVIDRELPGIAEALRAESMAHTPMAMLSRGVAGVRGKTLIVNFPGSPQACDQCFAVLEPILKHAHSQLNR